MSDIRMHVALLSVDIIDIEDKKFAQGILVFKNSVQQPKSSINANKQDRQDDKAGRPGQPGGPTRQADFIMGCSQLNCQYVCGGHKQN
jgi:hypothetical protein